MAALLGSEKAKKWVAGRADVSMQLAEIASKRDVGQPLVWLHAASLGEFEQGVAVLEAIRAQHPTHFILLSFFSPSGYEARKNYKGADAVVYLAEDAPKSAANWVAKLRPAIAIFVKYEFWPSFLEALKKAAVPTVLVAGSFRPQQPFFQWYGSGWRKMLANFDRLLLQTPQDAALLEGVNLPKELLAVTGDPRLDRTIQLAKTPFHDEVLAKFCTNYKCLFAGSVWQEDIDVILPLIEHLPSDWKLVIAPHELKAKELEQWAKSANALRYTTVKAGQTPIGNQSVLLLDTIGILSRAYRYGHLAYIGGAFRTGLHNTLEPMAYGLPIVFGPKYHKFPEAVNAVNIGGAFSVNDAQELIDVFKSLQEELNYQRAVSQISNYTKQAEGATAKTYDAIAAFLV